MYLPEWAQKFKESRTEIKCIKGKYYKYEVSHKYDPERKRSVKKTGRLLGKITEKDGFVPSSKNLLRDAIKELPKVDIKIYGIYALFNELLKDEIVSLKSVFGDKTSEQLLSFALMRWAYQSPIKRLADYHSHDFCSEFWSNDRLLSDKEITSTLKNVGENRELVLQWMKKLLPEGASGNENFVLMDSTHAISASEHLLVNSKGYNPNFDFEKQVRLMYMLAQGLKRPVYYRLINGNITDIASMSLCIKEMEIENVIYTSST
ncbi:hypothetical protein FACS1894126_5430 [Alphaproteobacteria bacterium]|nr:hypothetical protein FACS1894126_5430 [Alphaproteobacteria bacterium]